MLWIAFVKVEVSAILREKCKREQGSVDRSCGDYLHFVSQINFGPIELKNFPQSLEYAVAGVFLY